jgi:hypothetical protein
MCMGVTGSTGAVDRLRKEYDAEIIRWKTDVEVNTHVNTFASLSINDGDTFFTDTCSNSMRRQT